MSNVINVTVVVYCKTNYKIFENGSEKWKSKVNINCQM